jgi:hypothetical protein
MEADSPAAQNRGTLAQQIAAHESPRTAKLHDRTSDQITLDQSRAVTTRVSVAEGVGLARSCAFREARLPCRSVASPLFLIGAGFNADAADLVGAITNWRGERIPINARYPLVSDLWNICFDRQSPPADESIEERFAAAMANRDHGPLDRLCDKVMEADFYLAHRLSDAAITVRNPYAAFFDCFAESSYITFNYDALPEIFLYRRGRWYPDDGFGVPVVVQRRDDSLVPGVSRCFVFHLHGSLCVYPQTMSYHTTQTPGRVDTELRPLAEPLFHFDADSIGALFTPIARSMTLAYRHVAERVIAPVPDKASRLVEPFIQRSYARARDAVRRADHIVAIGYSFNDHDRTSYDPILEVIGKRLLSIVTPGATVVEKRLAARHTGLHLRRISRTFFEWARLGFPI